MPDAGRTGSPVLNSIAPCRRHYLSLLLSPLLLLLLLLPLVTTVLTAGMSSGVLGAQMDFLQRARRRPGLQRAHALHIATSAAGGVAFVGEEVRIAACRCP